MNDAELALAMGMAMAYNRQTYSRQSPRHLAGAGKATKNKRKAKKLARSNNRG